MRNGPARTIALTMSAMLAATIFASPPSWADETPPPPEETAITLPGDQPAPTSAPTTEAPTAEAPPLESTPAPIEVTPTSSASPTSEMTAPDASPSVDILVSPQEEQPAAEAKAEPGVKARSDLRVESRVEVGSGWDVSSAVFPGDWNGDNRTDIANIRSNGDLYLYKALNASQFEKPTRIGTGWTNLKAVIGGVDWDTDGTQDLITNTSSGDLKFYRNNFTHTAKIGTGWTKFRTLTGIQRSTNGKPALLGITANGEAWLYPTDGHLNFYSPVLIADNWTFKTVIGTTDWDNNGRDDYLAIDSQNRLRYLASDNNGYRFQHYQVGTGWNNYPRLATTALDGHRYLWAINTGGKLYRYSLITREPNPSAALTFDRRYDVHSAATVGSGWDVSSAVFPGDWNGDNRTDIANIRSNGDLYLYKALNASQFEKPTRIGTGWTNLKAVIGGVDWDTDGTQDLITNTSSGDLKFYRNNFTHTAKIGTGWTKFRTLTGIQRSTNGKPALLGITANGEAWLYPTDGHLNFYSPVLIADNWTFKTVIGTTDWDNNGRDDYLAIDSQNRLRYLASDNNGYRFQHYQVGTGWNNYPRLATTALDGHRYLWAINTGGKLTRFDISSREPGPAAPKQPTQPAPPPPPKVNVDSRCMTGRVLCASKSDRKLRWMINGQVVLTLDARFGSASNPSDNGAFRVQWKSRNHVSSIYHTPMPYAMFYNGGEAVHYSSDFAARGWAGASHGCINIRDKAAIAWLFDQVRVGDKVIVYQ